MVTIPTIGRNPNNISGPDNRKKQPYTLLINFLQINFFIMRFRFFCSILVWGLFQTVVQAQSPSVISQQIDLLTGSSTGWIISREVIISPYQAPVEYIYDPKGCVAREVLTFFKNGTYTRSFAGGNCSGASVTDTRGKWKYLADDKIYKDCMLVLRLDDEVNNLYDTDFMIASMMKDYNGVLMLIPNPDKSPTYSQKVLVYLPNNGVTPVAPNPSTVNSNSNNSIETKNSNTPSGPTKTTASTQGSTIQKTSTSPAVKESALIGYLRALKQEDIPSNHTFEEVYTLDESDQNNGVLYYSDNLTDTGPYALVSYKTNSGKILIADIRSNYSGSSLVVYESSGGKVSDVTNQILSPDTKAFLLKEGFDWWNQQYYDGKVPAKESEVSIVYTLPASNFLTQNPYVFVELQVTWQAGGLTNESRIIGQFEF